MRFINYGRKFVRGEERGCNGKLWKKYVKFLQRNFCSDKNNLFSKNVSRGAFIKRSYIFSHNHSNNESWWKGNILLHENGEIRYRQQFFFFSSLSYFLISLPTFNPLDGKVFVILPPSFSSTVIRDRRRKQLFRHENETNLLFTNWVN